MLRYFIINKPFQVLSQFSREGDKATLADVYAFPKDVYPVGRLDYDSEGLLILTNDTSLNHRLLDPSHSHEREYWVQVEGEPTAEALQRLSKGVDISINGKVHHTQPAKAQLLDNPSVPDRNPPIRYRANIPTTWISLSLTEGKNRQVRRMTAAVGFPTLRLIRHRIKKLMLQDIQPGEVRELSGTEIKALLFGK
jgi:23S rRNA pseudouridine2457 synthase